MADAPQIITFSVAPERLKLARRTHQSVSRTLAVAMGTLALVIAVLGSLLSQQGTTSLPGSLAVAAAFAVCAVFMVWSTSKTLRRAERFLAADGATLFVVGPTSLRVADFEIPYERITCMYAQVEGETYSAGGIRGEVMAYRMDLSEDRPTPGRAVGTRIGNTQRRKLYRDGAKSAISLAIGIDKKATLQVPEGVINPLKLLPHRGADPGRIDVPFGAFLSDVELQQLLGSVHGATGGNAFPIMIVSGILDWATASTSVCETRATIWEGYSAFIAAGTSGKSATSGS